MQGETAAWNPRAYLRRHHPDVRVIETDLPGQLLGCVDHEQRVIWLARGLDEVGQRCTLAFEIGQLQRGPTPQDPSLARVHQWVAEEWAAIRLIPFQRMCEAFRTVATIPEAAALLAVDTPTLRTRLRALTDPEQDAVMAAINCRLDADLDLA